MKSVQRGTLLLWPDVAASRRNDRPKGGQLHSIPSPADCSPYHAGSAKRNVRCAPIGVQTAANAIASARAHRYWDHVTESVDNIIASMTKRASKCRWLAKSVSDATTEVALLAMAAEIEADVRRLRASSESHDGG